MKVGASDSICPIAPGIVQPHINWYSSVHQLDMDRCTVRTQGGVETLLDMAKTFGVKPSVLTRIRNEQAHTERDGGSFDPLQFLQKELNPAQFDAFGDLFMKSDIDLAYPDSQDLYRRLSPADAHTVPHFYNTYGSNPLWQGLKVSRSGIPAWTILMPHSDKSGFAGNLRRAPENVVHLQAADKLGRPMAIYHIYGCIETTDDKSKSLEHTHPLDKGNMVWRLDETRLLSQGTKVPENVRNRVRIIHSLDEIIVERDMILASCSPARLPAGPLQPAVFQPVDDVSGYPGLYINRETPFATLRRQIEAML